MGKKDECISNIVPAIGTPCTDCSHSKVCKYKTDMQAIRDAIELILEKEVTDNARKLISQISYTCRHRSDLNFSATR